MPYSTMADKKREESVISGAGEASQSVSRLLLNHGDLSSDPQHSGVAACVCNRGSLARQGALGFSERPCLKSQLENQLEGTRDFSL